MTDVIGVLPHSADVVVVGSGAGGAAVAGELARQGRQVVVIEAGSHGSGEHGRNRDSSAAGTRGFGDFLGETLRPINRGDTSPQGLPGLIGVHGVGGMLVAWTHNTPVPDDWEVPSWIARAGWDSLIGRASALLHVGTGISTEDPRYEQFADVIAHRVGTLPEGRQVQPMPVAAQRTPAGWKFSGADTLLHGGLDKIRFITDHVVRSVEHRAGVVDGVVAYPVAGGAPVRISAGAVVIAAGTSGSAQLITASGLDAGPALGAYLTEHTIVATRVYLREALRRIEDSTAFPPGVWIPASRERQWSTTINATQWNFNPAIPESASFDNTVDILSFTPVEPQRSNRMTFELDRLDAFGLPSYSGILELSERDIEVTGDALKELWLLSNDLGDVSDGWGMRVPQRAGSHHLSGSCRMDAVQSDSSVVSPEGRLWGYENCYVAGNAVLSARTASNPTLTTVSLALHTADAISNPATASLATDLRKAS